MNARRGNLTRVGAFSQMKRIQATVCFVFMSVTLKRITNEKPILDGDFGKNTFLEP
jgi:hypothetical protein